jgi:hypothetical protein
LVALVSIVVAAGIDLTKRELCPWTHVAGIAAYLWGSAIGLAYLAWYLWPLGQRLFG